MEEGEVVLLLYPQHNLVSMVTVANVTRGFDRIFAEKILKSW